MTSILNTYLHLCTELCNTFYYSNYIYYDIIVANVPSLYCIWMYINSLAS